MADLPPNTPSSGTFRIPYVRVLTRNWWSILRGVVAGVGRNNLSVLAASVGFFAMLALFPALASAVWLYGYYSDPAAIQNNLAFFEPLLPADVFELVNGRLDALLGMPRDGLGLASVLGLVVASWGARSGVSALLTGLSIVSREVTPRSFLMRQLVAYGMTLLLLLVAMIAIAMFVVLPGLISLFPFGGFDSLLVSTVRWLVGIASLVLGIGTLYRYGPNRDGEMPPLLTPGVALAVVTWITSSAGFSLYVASIANYHEVYGSLGTVIAVLVWFYLSALAVFLGAELDAELESTARRLGLIGQGVA